MLSIIRKLRTDLNMTQKQPADKLGVSDKAVSKWERGLGCPDITLVTELSEILSVSLESLLSGSTETSDFKEVKYEKTACFHTHRHISPEYRWDTVLCISFPFDKKPLWHKPSTSTKRRIEAVRRHHTNEKAARISEPLFHCKHKKTPLRI